MLVFVVFVEKLAVVLRKSVFMSHLRMSSSSVVIRSFAVIYLGGVWFDFSLLGFCTASRFCGLMSFFDFGKFSAIIFFQIFLSSFGTPMTRT